MIGTKDRTPGGKKMTSMWKGGLRGPAIEARSNGWEKQEETKKLTVIEGLASAAIAGE